MWQRVSCISKCCTRRRSWSRTISAARPARVYGVRRSTEKDVIEHAYARCTLIIYTTHWSHVPIVRVLTHIINFFVKRILFHMSKKHLIESARDVRKQFIWKVCKLLTFVTYSIGFENYQIAKNYGHPDQLPIYVVSNLMISVGNG